MSMFSEYKNNLIKALNEVNSEKIALFQEHLISHITKYPGCEIVLAGNGGSAAIAEHFVCDLSKGVTTNTSLKVNARSLTSNIPIITAIANDIGYEHIFTEQYKNFEFGRSFVILISSSGNSKNIINLYDYIAGNINPTSVWSFTGFDGGKLKKKCRFFNIHVPINNYGIVEDIHHLILHSVCQDIRKKYLTNEDNIWPF